MSRNVQVGLQQELKCLVLIGRFGWLRRQEIGMFLWPRDTDTNRYQYATNLVNKLKKKGFVFTSILPMKAGTAVVLNDAGANFANENGYLDIRKGNLDEYFFETYSTMNVHITWNRPRSWMHDLYGHGLCALLMAEFAIEFDRPPLFFTENELKRRGATSNKFLLPHRDQVRYPDLLIETNELVGGKIWLGIEIEKSRKFGQKNRQNMILNLIQNNKVDGCARHNFKGVEPNLIAFAFNPIEVETTHSGSKKRINHEKNIITSTFKEMERQNVEKVKMVFIKLKIKNFGVSSYKIDFITLRNKDYSLETSN